MAITVTKEQITAATDALAAQKLGITVQLEQALSYEAERSIAAAEREVQAVRYTESAQRQERQTLAVERAAAAAEKAAATQEQAFADMLNPKQELYLALYDKHLKVRLGPSVITSNTADLVLDDMVRDAQRMTDVVYPSIQAALDKLV